MTAAFCTTPVQTKNLYDYPRRFYALGTGKHIQRVVVFLSQADEAKFMRDHQLVPPEHNFWASGRRVEFILRRVAQANYAFVFIHYDPTSLYVYQACELALEILNSRERYWRDHTTDPVPGMFSTLHAPPLAEFLWEEIRAQHAQRLRHEVLLSQQ